MFDGGLVDQQLLFKRVKTDAAKSATDFDMKPVTPSLETIYSCSAAIEAKSSHESLFFKETKSNLRAHGRTHRAGFRSVTRPLTSQNKTNTEKHSHPCSDWDTNPRE